MRVCLPSKLLHDLFIHWHCGALAAGQVEQHNHSRMASCADKEQAHTVSEPDFERLHVATGKAPNGSAAHAGSS